MWIAGALGNRPRIWRTPSEIPQNEPELIIMLRHATPGSHLLREDLAPAKAVQAMAAQPDGAYLANESMPDHLATLQAELIEMPELVMRYREYPRVPHRMERMRAAMQHARQAKGLAAHLLLRRWLDSASMDTLRYLLDEYPGHVIELTAYSTKVGVERSNTIFWETRAY